MDSGSSLSCTFKAICPHSKKHHVTSVMTSIKDGKGTSAVLIKSTVIVFTNKSLQTFPVFESDYVLE